MQPPLSLRWHVEPTRHPFRWHVPGTAPISVTQEKILLRTSLIAARGDAGRDGAPGGSSIERVAGVAIGGQRGVMIDAAGLAQIADASDPDVELAGVSLHAAAEGAPLLIQIAGEIIEPSWSWSVGPVWLGLNGLLTQVPPVTGTIWKVGSAAGPTALQINPHLIAKT